ncbi:MAG: monofunctional biosynthetic peptidoglycan transglycosylase [Pseudomonadota bacterium]
MARLKRKSAFRLWPGKPRPARKPAKSSARWWRILRWPLRLIVLLLVACVLWVGAYRFVAPPGGIYLASEAWTRGSISQDLRQIEDVSPRLGRAIIAAEDARFCDHYGFDFQAIRDAIRLNEQGKRTYGASTITQQVAKNMFLWHQRSWLRKGLEAGFTVLIEVLWPKRRILEIYMNSAEFAPGVFGAEAAAQHHFGRPASALTPTQAARLAAVLPNPKARSASKPSSFVRRRARSIAAGAATIRAEQRDTCVY